MDRSDITPPSPKARPAPCNRGVGALEASRDTETGKEASGVVKFRDPRRSRELGHGESREEQALGGALAAWTLFIFIFLFSHLADAFIQSDLQMRTL